MSLSDWSQGFLSCPVCLETLTDPTTLSCGHSYCLPCIQHHWDRVPKEGPHECPQCRCQFTPRPQLSRSRALEEALETLRLSGNQESHLSIAATSKQGSSAVLSVSSGNAPAPGDVSGVSLYPSLPSDSPSLCPLHQQVLELYCIEDRQTVCEECSLMQHKTHRVIRPEEELSRVQEELVKVKARIKSSVAEREKLFQRLPQVSQAHQSSLQQLTEETRALFSDLSQMIMHSGSQIQELFQAHENATLSLIQTQTYGLQMEIGGLKSKLVDIQRLCDIQDPIALISSFNVLESTSEPGDAVLQIQSPEALLSGVRSALESFRETAEHLNKENLARVFRVVNDAAAATQSSILPSNGDLSFSSPVNPCQTTVVQPKAEASCAPPAQEHRNKTEAPSAFTGSSTGGSQSFAHSYPTPKSREELLKFRFEPTLDQNSVFRHIRLSEDSRRATLCAEKVNYTDHPERFLFWRQVMCVEPLAGSPYYWEVEWTGQRVSIGVAYKDLCRSSSDDSARLGYNSRSWSLYWSGKSFSLFHNGEETHLDCPKSRRLGVYLDPQAGTLSFYHITHTAAHKEAQEICRIQATFEAPLYPCFRFWTGVGSTISICDL